MSMCWLRAYIDVTSDSLAPHTSIHPTLSIALHQASARRRQTSFVAALFVAHGPSHHHTRALAWRALRQAGGLPSSASSLSLSLSFSLGVGSQMQDKSLLRGTTIG
jgi:acid phosphatase family membrane protein YuiD